MIYTLVFLLGACMAIPGWCTILQVHSITFHRGFGEPAWVHRFGRAFGCGCRNFSSGNCTCGVATWRICCKFATQAYCRHGSLINYLWKLKLVIIGYFILVFLFFIFLFYQLFWVFGQFSCSKSNSGGRDLHFFIVWTQTDLEIMVSRH